MIDSLRRLLPLATQSDPAQKLGLGPRYGVVTLHRPSNVDNPTQLQHILGALNDISQDLPLCFPVHPRTRQRIEAINLKPTSHLQLMEPLGYLDFLALESRATLAITDSGGVQEETTFLGVPCFTVRENTERPITVTWGSNTLVGQDMRRLQTAVEDVLKGDCKLGRIPPLWDGKAAQRIARMIDEAVPSPRHRKALPALLYGKRSSTEDSTLTENRTPGIRPPSPYL